MTRPLFDEDALAERVKELVDRRLAELGLQPGASEILTVEEAAAIAKLKPPAIRAWIKDGDLPARKIGKGKCYRIRRADLDAALTPGARQKDRDLSPEERAARDLAKLGR